MMGRLLFSVVALVALVAVMGAAAPGKADLKISADADGVTLKTSKFTGSAQGLKYDQAKGQVVLIGSIQAPAKLEQAGSATKLQAERITIFLATGSVRIENLLKANKRLPK